MIIKRKESMNIMTITKIVNIITKRRQRTVGRQLEARKTKRIRRRVRSKQLMTQKMLRRSKRRRRRLRLKNWLMKQQELRENKSKQE
jgi:predicted transcriptional regulator